MLDFRYRAFLCYSHRDSAWADWLHRALESYPIPSRLVGLTTSAGVIPPRLAPVFRDRDELPSATDLSAKVSDALAQSACLIVICSPHSAQSHWVDEEVRAFQRFGRADRIFCLIVDGEPGASAWAGREHDECLPPALTRRVDAAGNETGERFEPIAADARPGKDGKTNARTKLVAGILGVDLDDLRHREQRQRRWKRAVAVGGGLVVLCLTCALAVNAVIARHAAERRQKQAEDLVGFMLGDLDDKLRQVNRLDILESIADKSVKYFAALPLADMTDDTLAQHAKALQKIGRVRQDQSRMPEAESAFKAAQETSGELVRRAPTRSDYAALDAENLQWLGRVSWARGDLGGALSRFTAARADLDRLSSSQLDEGVVADLSGSVRTNIGRVYEARGDLDAARAEYVVVLRTYERLSAREPDRLNWKAEVGYAHNNLGQLAWKDGHLDVAIREYAADRLIKASLAALEPNNNARREDLLISNAILGNALVAVGETAAARTYLRAAVADAEKLVASDSTVSAWQDDAGYYGMRLATWARLQGDLPTAMRYGDRSLVILRKLVDQDPANVSWARELAEDELEAARRLLVQRRTSDAAEMIKSAIARIGALLEKNGDDRTFALVQARARITAGDIASAARDDAEAGHEWKLAASAAETAVEAAADPSWLDARASALMRLGDVAGAESLVARLAAMGYRHPDLMSAASAAGIAPASDPDVARRIEAAMAALQDGSDTAATEASTRPPPT